MTGKLARKTLKKWLPERLEDSNKSDGGKVFIVGGGRRYKGAGILSALAATRAGAGYTHLMSNLAHYPWLLFPDFIVHKFSSRELGKNRDAVIAIGPGLGLEKDKEKLLKFLLSQKIKKVVVDADALTILAKLKIKRLPPSWILTPHEVELARLLGTTSRLVKKNREAALEKAHRKYGCTILLKGQKTLVASEMKLYEFKAGPKALAKAGTGDVLLGIIAAMYAQNEDPFLAAAAGHFIHLESCLSWQKMGRDHLSLRPMDLITEMPRTIKRLRRKPSLIVQFRSFV